MNHESESPQEELPPDGLDWLAWQFVAGELDEAACQAWVERISRDPEALLAVERAIELNALGESVFRVEPAHLPMAAVDDSRAEVYPASTQGPTFSDTGSPSKQRTVDAGQARRAQRPRPAFLAIAASLLALVAGIRVTAHWLQLRQDERMLASFWSEQYATDEISVDQIAWDDVEPCADDLACAEAEAGLADDATDDEDWVLGAALSLEGMLDNDGEPIVF